MASLAQPWEQAAGGTRWGQEEEGGQERRKLQGGTQRKRGEPARTAAGAGRRAGCG